MMEYTKKEQRLRFLNPVITNLKSYFEGYFPSTEYKFFIFLCGAAVSNPNSNRKVFEQYLRQNYPKYELFLAEDYFKNVREISDLLTIETFLADFADCILIFLESESAFTELGAFSGNEKVLKRILVVNNKKYKDAKSFVNLGPISLVEKRSVYSKIVYSKFGAILENANQVVMQIEKAYRNRPFVIRFESAKKHLPNICEYSNKELVNFLIDLLVLLVPIPYNDLILIIENIFSHEAKKMKIVQGTISLLQTLQFFTYENELLFPGPRVLSRGLNFTYDKRKARRVRAQVLQFYRKNDLNRMKLYEAYINSNWGENDKTKVN